MVGGMYYSGYVKYIFQDHLVIDIDGGAAYLLDRNGEYIDLTYKSRQEEAV